MKLSQEYLKYSDNPEKRKGKSIKFTFRDSINELQKEKKFVEDWGGKMNKTGRLKNDRFAGVVEKAFRGEDLA